MIEAMGASEWAQARLPKQVLVSRERSQESAVLSLDASIRIGVCIENGKNAYYEIGKSIRRRLDGKSRIPKDANILPASIMDLESA